MASQHAKINNLTSIFNRNTLLIRLILCKKNFSSFFFSPFFFLLFSFKYYIRSYVRSMLSKKGLYMKKDVSKFLDVNGQPLTQSLFLEIGYSTKYAIYTLKDYDHEYKGKIYPSIKHLYLDEEDPTEYVFANKYFMSWSHWKRVRENKVLQLHINEWREELEIRLRSMA